MDILFISDIAKFPIELKKTNTKPTTDNIRKYYLSQAQSYAATLDKLGVFILLDNSSKKNEIQSPTNDLRDLFKIESLEPYYNENPTTNYLVTVIIPGNKITPSQRSKYK